MAKMKVHELAKELNVPSKDIITFLEGNSIEVKSHMSVLEDDMVSLVKSHYRKKNTAPGNRGGFRGRGEKGPPQKEGEHFCCL